MVLKQDKPLFQRNLHSCTQRADNFESHHLPARVSAELAEQAAPVRPQASPSQLPAGPSVHEKFK